MWEKREKGEGKGEERVKVREREPSKQLRYPHRQRNIGECSQNGPSCASRC